MATLKLKTKSEKQTIDIGKTIGANLKGGEVIELVSDLGGGKTTLTRGLAKGAGISEQVSSPSFTICNEYSGSKLKIYHFDFYRLNDPGIVRLELAEVLNQIDKVVIIEWPAIIENSIPKERLVIEIMATTKNGRQLNISYPDSLAYLTGGLK